MLTVSEVTTVLVMPKSFDSKSAPGAKIVADKFLVAQISGGREEGKGGELT